MSVDVGSINWSIWRRALKTIIALPVPVLLGWWVSYIFTIPSESKSLNFHIIGVFFTTVVWISLLLWRDYRTEVNRALVVSSVQDELNNANIKQKILDKILQSRNEELIRLLNPDNRISAKYYINNFFTDRAGIEQILKGLVSYLSNLPEVKKSGSDPSFRASLAPRINNKQCQLMYHAVSTSVNSPELNIKFTENKDRSDTTLAGYCLQTGRTEVISNVDNYMSPAGMKGETKKNNKQGFQYLKEKDKILIKSIMCHPITDTDGKNGEEFCGVLSIDTNISGFFSGHSDELKEYYWVEAIDSFLVRIKFYTRLSNISKEIDYNDIA